MKRGPLYIILRNTSRKQNSVNPRSTLNKGEGEGVYSPEGKDNPEVNCPFQTRKHLRKA